MQTERWYKRESNSCFYCNASGFGLHGHRQDSHPRTKRGRNCHKEEQRLHCFPYKSLPMNRELFRFHPIDKRADKCPQVTADWVWSIWRAIFATGGISSPYDTNSAAYARITPDRVCDATSAIGLQAFESIVGFCCTTFKKQRCNIFSSFFAYPLSLIWVSWAWRFLDIVNRPQLIRYLLATESAKPAMRVRMHHEAPTCVLQLRKGNLSAQFPSLLCVCGWKRYGTRVAFFLHLLVGTKSCGAVRNTEKSLPRTSCAPKPRDNKCSDKRQLHYRKGWWRWEIVILTLFGGFPLAVVTKRLGELQSLDWYAGHARVLVVVGDFFSICNTLLLAKYVAHKAWRLF